MINQEPFLSAEKAFPVSENTGKPEPNGPPLCTARNGSCIGPPVKNGGTVTDERYLFPYRLGYCRNFRPEQSILGFLQHQTRPARRKGEEKCQLKV